MKRLWAALTAAVFLLCGCLAQGSGSSSSAPDNVGGSTKRDAVRSEEVQFTAAGSGDVYVTLHTSRGDIRLVLYPQYAPLAVENFCTLASQGYYDGTEFHRVVADFAIQGGDASGTGYSGQSAWGSPLQTERSDALRHYSGALCMAGEDGAADSHLSQFYILATGQNSLDDSALNRLLANGERDAVVETYRQAGGAPWLDYTDTVFGQVVGGMDVVDKIAQTATEEGGRPKTAVVVESVTIENYTPLYLKGRPLPRQLEGQNAVDEENMPDNMDDIPDNKEDISADDALPPDSSTGEDGGGEG